MAEIDCYPTPTNTNNMKNTLPFFLGFIQILNQFHIELSSTNYDYLDTTLGLI